MEGFFSDSTGLYFFSALLQANAAILAIVGIFVIFKIQSFESGIDVIKNALSAERGISTTIDSDPSIIVEYEWRSPDDRRIFKQGIIDARVLRLLEDWDNKDEAINRIKSGLKYPSFILCLKIVFDAAGILIINGIHKFNNVGEAVIYLVFLAGQIYVFFVIIRSMQKTINYSYKDKYYFG